MSTASSGALFWNSLPLHLRSYRPYHSLSSFERNHREHLNPFTVPAGTISGLKDARTPLQTVHFPVLLAHLFSMLCVFMKIPSQAGAKNKAKSLRVSNLVLLLVAFK